MSAGAVADSGLIGRVSFTCDTGQAQYLTMAGFSLSTTGTGSAALNETVNTITSSFRLANGLTVDISDDATGSGSTASNGVPTGLIDEFFSDAFGSKQNRFRVNLNYIGQGEPPSGDTEQELKDNYFTRLRAVNHTDSVVGQLVASEFSVSTPFGDAVAQGTPSSTDAYRVQLGYFPAASGSTADGDATDKFKWGLNDQVTVDFLGY